MTSKEIRIHTEVQATLEVSISEDSEISDGESTEKENLRRDGVRTSTRSKLARMGQLYAGAEISSPIQRTEHEFCLEPKLASVKAGQSAHRSTRLAELASRINQWEDDLSHPTVKPKPTSPKRDKFGNLIGSKAVKHSPVRASLSLADVITNSPKAKQQQNLAKREGESQGGENKVKKFRGEKPKDEPKAPSNCENFEELKIMSPQRPSGSINTLKGSASKERKQNVVSERVTSLERAQNQEMDVELNMNLKRGLVAQERRLERGSDSERGGTKPKIVAWDAKILNSLEAQGFSRCDSNEHLLYSFSKETNLVCSSPKKSSQAVVNPQPKAATPPPPSPPPPPPAQAQTPAPALARSTVATLAATYEAKSPRPPDSDPAFWSVAAKRQIFDSQGAEPILPKAPITSSIPGSLLKNVDLDKNKAGSGGPPPPPPLPLPRSPADYPGLSDCKKIRLSPIKPGHLYPDLSTIEVSESELSATETSVEVQDSAETSSPTEATSAGEITEAPSAILHQMDEYLDHVMDSSVLSSEVSDTHHHESAEGDDDDDEEEESADVTESADTSLDMSFEPEKPPEVPLVKRTVSTYRREQKEEKKRLAAELATEESPEDEAQLLSLEQNLVKSRIDQLTEDLKKAEAMILQSSQALNLCKQTVEFSGSTEQAEGERLLLLGTERRRLILEELERLKVNRRLSSGLSTTSLRQYLSTEGNVTLKGLRVPINMDLVHMAAREDSIYYVLALFRSGSQVVASELLSTRPQTLLAPGSCSQDVLVYPKQLSLRHLRSDFVACIDLYTMKGPAKELLPHDLKYRIGLSRRTPKKKAGKRTVPESPGGPGIVRTSGFKMAGFVTFGLKDVSRKSFSLARVGPSIIGDSITTEIITELTGSAAPEILTRGFLTQYQEIGGFGSWVRRWAALTTDSLSFWSYPTDQGTKTPLDSIMLVDISNREVGLVQREICARPNTLIIETTRPALPTDKNDLTCISDGRTTTVRHLLSADTRQERQNWSRHLNKRLAMLDSWGLRRIPTKSTAL